MRDIERCDREIAEVERLLRAGHRDIEGLCRALIDWSVERRFLLEGFFAADICVPNSWRLTAKDGAGPRATPNGRGPVQCDMNE